MREKKQMHLANWEKRDRVMAQKLCDAFPFHIYLEYAIYFNVYVVLDILSAWER